MLQTIRLLYYTLFALTPLIMSSHTSEMFEFNKMMLIYGVATIVAGLYGFMYVIYRPNVVVPRWGAWYLVFFVSIVISMYFSIDQHTSIYGYYGRWNGGLVSIMAYIVLLFVFIQVFDKQSLIRLLVVSLASSTLVILWAVPGWLGYDLSCLLFTGTLTNTCWTVNFAPDVRMFSTIGQPNWLGAYLAIHLFIGVYFIIFRSDRQFQHNKTSLVIGIYLLLNLFALYATKSKSAWYAVGFVLFFAALLVFARFFKKHMRSWIIGGSVGLVLIITGVFLIFIPRYNASQVPEHLEITDSFTIRTYVWQGAVDLWRQYPLTGTGPETFAYAYPRVKPAIHNLTSEWDFIYNKAHNEFLNYLATTGILGFLGYMGIVGSSLWLFHNVVGDFLNKRKNLLKVFINNSMSYVLMLSYITILITNFFGFSTSTIQLFFYLIPGMLIIYQHKKPYAEPALTQGKFISKSFINWSDILNQSFQIKFAMTAVVIITIALLANIVRMYRADMLYAQAQSQFALQDSSSAVQSLSTALQYHYEHVYENKLSSYLAHIAFMSSFDPEYADEARELITKSKTHNAYALKHSPHNIEYWRTKARNYYFYYQSTHDVNDLMTATDVMKYTTQIAPHDPQSHYMSALFSSILYGETGKKQYKQDVITYGQQALALRPQYSEARKLLDTIK